MSDNWRRLQIYLKNAKKGFFLVEACDRDVIRDVIYYIDGQKSALVVDFAIDDESFYNETVIKGEYDCVVFCNLEYSGHAEAIIDSFNMNRDNFASMGIVYVFVLPKYLMNYLIVKTPNLRSYATGNVDLCRNYEAPFRALLSLDTFVIDKTKYHEAKSDVRNFKNHKKIETSQELFQIMEYYKYHIASKDDLIEILKVAAVILDQEHVSCAKRFYLSHEDESGMRISESPYVRFYIEFSKTAFNQWRYQIAEYACFLALSRITEDFALADVSSDKYALDRKKINARLYVIACQGYESLLSDYSAAAPLIDLIRIYAASKFYQKDYEHAADWFNLVNTLVEYCEDRFGVSMSNIKCLNLSDMSLNEYKRHDNQICEKQEMFFNRAFDMKESSELEVNTLFVLDYNDIVFKIKNEKIRFEDYDYSSCRADYYKRVCDEKSFIFSSYLSLVAWLHGCIEGNVLDAFDVNNYALNLKRDVLTENHFSIAESHYCNCVLYFMMGEEANARHCLAKAAGILKSNAQRNHTMLSLVESFEKKYFTTERKGQEQ